MPVLRLCFMGSYYTTALALFKKTESLTQSSPAHGGTPRTQRISLTEPTGVTEKTVRSREKRGSMSAKTSTLFSPLTDPQFLPMLRQSAGLRTPSERRTSPHPPPPSEALERIRRTSATGLSRQTDGGKVRYASTCKVSRKQKKIYPQISPTCQPLAD